MKTKETFIVIKQDESKSILDDFVTYALAFLLIYVGVYFDSTAMQWLGVMAFVLHCINAKPAGWFEFETLSDARKFLENREG